MLILFSQFDKNTFNNLNSPCSHDSRESTIQLNVVSRVCSQILDVVEMGIDLGSNIPVVRGDQNKIVVVVTT